MQLNVDVEGAYHDYTTDINLDELVALDWVLDWEDMRVALILALAEVAVYNRVAFDAVTPDYVEDNDQNDTLKVHVGDDNDWMADVAKLAWYVQDDYDEPRHLAYISNEGWEYFDFDNMRQVDDEFSQEFDGDYEDFAVQELENQGITLPEEVENYFDFRRYGEDQLDSYSVCEWGSVKYMFHQ